MFRFHAALSAQYCVDRRGRKHKFQGAHSQNLLLRNLHNLVQVSRFREMRSNCFPAKNRGHSITPPRKGGPVPFLRRGLHYAQRVRPSVSVRTVNECQTQSTLRARSFSSVERNLKFTRKFLSRPPSSPPLTALVRSHAAFRETESERERG